ncbi:MAG: UvrD-helicase domain-containing protein [Syntrophales bacterium]
MTKDLPFVLPVITDEDICWATNLFELPATAFCGEDRTDPRQEVLKSMIPIDVAACPGSGKTTLLVAKLAILALRWQYRTRGICVLSHTNAARHEIEARIGHTAVGRRLLGYPHFIGTIHGFVNEFLALPWLRSKGYPIKIIDTDICRTMRWSNLPFKIRSGLESNNHNSSVLSVKSPEFSLGEVRWGKQRVLRTETPTYCAMKIACQLSATKGYFCYDEMFMWASELMTNVPGIVLMIRERFPLLFVDEAQDNSEEQSAILHRIFMDGDGSVVRQRFGDANQAIFDFIDAKETTTDGFPIDSIKKDLPNSHRFGQNIANLADPLGLSPYGLKGHGPKQKNLSINKSEAQHTILLFDENNIDKVLAAYGELLIETFSEQALREGTFTAVGQIHRYNGDDHKPRHIGHYWSDYDPELSSKEPKPRTFMQYVFAGLRDSQTTGQTHLAVEKIAEGILRLSGMAAGGAMRPHRRHNHRYVLTILEDFSVVRKTYEDLIAKFAMERDIPTKETWNGLWRGVVHNVATTIAGVSLSNPDALGFLEWKYGDGAPVVVSIAQKSHDNIYRFSRNNKEVAVKVGSVHSVKGETHTATLVLETFWHNHNLESIINWLCADQKGFVKQSMRIKNRLKIHYVAMTRPSHLLCLAMKRSIFEDNKGSIDMSKVQKLEQCGWQVKTIE